MTFKKILTFFKLFYKERNMVSLFLTECFSMLRRSFVVQINLYVYLPTPFPISIDTVKENCNCQSMNIKKVLV